MAPVPSHVASTLSDHDNTPSESSGYVARVIKIPDPDQFYADKAKDNILYEDWHLQMLSKMSINASAMLTEASKRGYVQSQTGSHALTQLKPRLRPNATNPFRTADEMFEVLTAAFGNAN